jgi:transmembrane sensor
MDIPEKNKVPVNLIAKYLNGEANTDDIIDLEKWKSQSGDNRKVFDEYRTIWEKTGQLSLFADIDIENEWNVFLENIDLEKEKIKKEQRSTAWKPLIRIAAIIVAGIILSVTGLFVYQGLRYEKLYAKNEVLEIGLPDGSSVTLNRGSKMIHPKKFDDIREISLNGEAFFEVTRDPARPFVVRSGEVIVEVLGTSFNFYAYKKENVAQVIVESGKVAVYNDDDSSGRKDILKKGERMIYSRKDGVRTIQPNTDINYKSWKTGILRFENSSLQYVVNLLEKHYQERITLVNSRLNECRITVSFNNKSLDYVLETITETLGLKLLKTENGYFIDGPGC